MDHHPTTTTYPVNTKQAAGLVGGIPTDVMLFSFTDKIMITITQEGRLAQWMQVPLGSTGPGGGENYLSASSDDDGLLPLTHLTPHTLLGGANAERENIGRLYAAQIASAIATKNPDESRTVLIGFGLSKVTASRDIFFDLLDLVTQCL